MTDKSRRLQKVYEEMKVILSQLGECKIENENGIIKNLIRLESRIDDIYKIIGYGVTDKNEEMIF